MGLNVISINITALDISSASQIYCSAQTVGVTNVGTSNASISNEALAVNTSSGEGPFNFTTPATAAEFKANIRQQMCNRALQDYSGIDSTLPIVFAFYGLTFFDLFGLAPAHIEEFAG